MDFARLSEQSLDLSQLQVQGFPEPQLPECGAMVVFCGMVRNHHLGKAVTALHYTAYAPLAERLIREIEREIEHEHQVAQVRVVHRLGRLEIGEVAIYGVAYAGHRREAFAACEAAIERVKHEVPVWKEEFYADGSSVFVEGCCIRRDFEPAAAQCHPARPDTAGGCGH